MELKPGTRLKSAVCTAEIVIVKPPKAEAVIACGGRPMLAPGDPAPAPGQAPDPAHAGGVKPGKRYADAESGLEVLCAKGGTGSLSIDGRAIAMLEAKKLPSSD